MLGAHGRPRARPSQPALSAKPRLLCVDDEPIVLESLRDVLRRTFDVRTATNGPEALAMLRREPRGYAVVLSDMRMPGMPGSVFLREARRCAPTAVRMLLTGYADSDAAAAAVNDGQIFRYLTKPCDRHQLKQACVGALAHHRALVAERELLEQTLHGSIQALTDVLALASPAAFGRSARLKDLTAGLVRAAGAGDAWEIEVASMLVNLGAVTLPEATAEKLHCGGALEPRRDRHGRPDPRGHRADPGQHPAAGGRPRDRRRPRAPLRRRRARRRAPGCCGSQSTSWRWRPRARRRSWRWRPCAAGRRL